MHTEHIVLRTESYKSLGIRLHMKHNLLDWLLVETAETLLRI
jgi:hypothetical protein